MKNLIRNLISITCIFIFFSCAKKKDIELLSRDNELLIQTYGKPSDDRFVASFNSTQTSKDTLFISKIEYENEKALKR